MLKNDTKLMESVIALAEELHFGLAAQKLHVAISTLSKQIAQLEEKLGLKLFTRNSKGVELTDAGRAYVEETRASLLHAEKAVNAARAANEGKDYILTAGHSPYADLAIVAGSDRFGSSVVFRQGIRHRGSRGLGYRTQR